MITIYCNCFDIIRIISLYIFRCVSSGYCPSISINFKYLTDQSNISNSYSVSVTTKVYKMIIIYFNSGTIFANISRKGLNSTSSSNSPSGGVDCEYLSFAFIIRYSCRPKTNEMISVYFNSRQSSSSATNSIEFQCSIYCSGDCPSSSINNHYINKIVCVITKSKIYKMICINHYHRRPCGS